MDVNQLFVSATYWHITMTSYGRDGVSNHQPHDCLLNRLFRHRSKKTSKLRVIGLCVGNSPGTDEFPAQMASNAENVSISWRHHASNIYWFTPRETSKLDKHNSLAIQLRKSRLHEHSWNFSILQITCKLYFAFIHLSVPLLEYTASYGQIIFDDGANYYFNLMYPSM